MKELLRLLSYARRYWLHLVASVILMAVAGAAQGALALLVRPIFDRVLTADRPAGLTPLLAKPVFGHQVFLEQVVPFQGRSIWFMVAFALIACFLIKGICDYLGNYLISYAGFSSVTDLRNAVFDKVLSQRRRVLRSALHRPADVVHHERHRQGAGGHLADAGGFLPAEFHRISLLFVLVSTDWKLALVSLTVLPAVMLPVTRIGRRIRRTSRRTQDRQAELNQILQETLQRPHGGESFRRRRRTNRASSARPRAACSRPTSATSCSRRSRRR